MKLKTLAVVALMLVAAAPTMAEEQSSEPKAELKLKTHFNPLYAKFGHNSTTKLTVISGPVDVKMRNHGVPGKCWIATCGKYRMKLTIENSVGYDLCSLIEHIEKIPGPYIRACQAVSDEKEDGIAVYADLGGASAHGGKQYINIVPRASALTLAHEMGHTLEQIARESDSAILDRWDKAITADNISVSDYGDKVRHEDLAEFAQVYAVCLDHGPESLAELKQLSPERYSLWEEILEEPKGSPVNSRPIPQSEVGAP